jgi:hypothetical protein
MSAVAQRTGNFTSNAAIYASGSTSTTYIGWGTSANTCIGSAHSGAATVTVPCTDGLIHSITIDAATSPSASVTAYADGTAGTPSPGTVAYSGSGLGLGATGAGLDGCTCQISELLIFADAHNASFATALGSSGVATLRANQRAAFGF